MECDEEDVTADRHMSKSRRCLAERTSTARRRKMKWKNSSIFALYESRRPFPNNQPRVCDRKDPIVQLLVLQLVFMKRVMSVVITEMAGALLARSSPSRIG